jgi:hypothetical protein
MYKICIGNIKFFINFKKWESGAGGSHCNSGGRDQEGQFEPNQAEFARQYLRNTHHKKCWQSGSK